MGVSCSYWLFCNICDGELGSSSPDIVELFLRAEASGWTVSRFFKAAVCEDCLAGNEGQLPHFQNPDVFCVLCVSREHLQVICR